MDDKEFDELFRQYLGPLEIPLDEVVLADIHWIRGNPEVGSDKMRDKHGVSEEEVEDVLFAIPPRVEAKRHPDHPELTLFWGQTSKGRWLFIVCHDLYARGKRTLTPLTAYTPDSEIEYWRSYE